MEKIVVLDALAIPSSYPLLRPKFEHEWVSYPVSTQDEILSRAHDATIIATSKCKLNASILAKLTKLKHIAVMATGFNNIDIDYCKQNNIAVTNIQNYSTESVAEHTLTMMLMLSRSMLDTRSEIVSGAWSKSPIFFMMPGSIQDLKDKTLTVIGSGAIGSRIIEIAKAFGMKTIKAEHKNVENIRDGYTEFFKAIESADFISVNCPLNDSTANLFTKSEFNKVKNSVFIINNARGGVINEADLVEALDKKLIAGAASDVVSVEPLPLDHPYTKILNRSNFILTPHQAWCSAKSLEDLIVQLKENMEAFYEGRSVRRIV